jgi:septum site-determining protein MinC
VSITASVRAEQANTQLARQASAQQGDEPVAFTGSAPTSFEIKTATLPVLALRLKSADLDLVSREFAERYGDIPAFFEGDAMVIDLSRLQPADSAVDFARLVDILRRYKLSPAAVRGGNTASSASAAAAGLFEASGAHITAPREAPAPEPSTGAASVAPPSPAAALVIDKPLRGGQQVYARGRDLVVLAMVNPGAEVIADGHIHVYAPLRGRAIAGARGDTDARVFSLAMEPELISIAGVYRTGDIFLPDSVRGKPAQVRLLAGAGGERLVMEPIKA